MKNAVRYSYIITDNQGGREEHQNSVLGADYLKLDIPSMVEHLKIRDKSKTKLQKTLVKISDLVWRRFRKTTQVQTLKDQN